MQLNLMKPTPQSGEEQSDFISRCIPIVVGEGVEQKEAVGRCFGIWASSKNKAFNSLEQLPNDVKALPTLAQQLWMASFNSAESLGKSADDAEADAWAKVKQGWEFDESGAVWKLKPEKSVGDTTMITILNETTDKGYFKTWIPLDYENGKLKVFEKEVKKDGEEPVKRKFLHGVASNTNIDKEDERVSPEFIKKMQETAVGLNVFLEHDHSLDKTLGTVTGSGGDELNFWAETMLEPEEDNENVVKVLKKSSNGIKLGYSIGGRATAVSKGVDADTGKEYLQLDDGDLFELSVTPMPAGNGTWVTPIAKSMRELVREYETKEHESNVEKKSMDEEKSNTSVKPDGQIELAKNLTELLTKNLNQADFSKALEEMVQVDEIKDQMFDFWWAFRDAMHFITFSEDLTPEEKGEKIKMYAEEFADKIVELTSSLATLVEIIDEALTS